MKEPISEVHNCDCLTYMKTLPDKYFEIALCDPPYGDALGGQRTGSDNASTGTSHRLPPQQRKQYNRFGGRFNRYKPVETGSTGAYSSDTDQSKGQPRLGGERFERYATYKDAHERREDAEILPFLGSRTDGKEEKVKYGSINWDIAPPQEYWDELFRISKNQIIWGGNYFSLPPTRCFIVWRKLSISENFSMAMAEYAWTSFNDNAKVYEAVPQRGKNEGGFHPTEKSIALYMWTLKRFAKAGDKIFDSHMGSQNSRIAAYNLNLDYWGCEIDKTYFEKGCAHFEEICHGVKKLKDGRTLKELSIFDFEE